MKFIKNIHYFSTNINVRYYSVQYLTVMSYPISQQSSKFIAIDYLTTTQIVTPITTLVMARETAAIVIFDVGGKWGESVKYSGRKQIYWHKVI